MLTQLSIEVFPNGDRDMVKGYVPVFLFNNGDHDISLQGELTTPEYYIDFDYTRPVKTGQRLGDDTLLTHAECADTYKDKDFVVEAKLEMPGEVIKIAGKQSAAAPQKRKLSVLEKVYNKMTRTDFILVFEGTEVPCHKHILARVAKCHGYDRYIRVKIFAGWGKKSGRTGLLAKLSLSWEGFAQLM